MTKDEFRAEQVRALKAWHERELSTFPEICREMKCEAKTRNGTPCQNSGSDYGNGRCKYHGGLSTGPKTAEGKARSAANHVARWHPDDPEVVARRLARERDEKFQELCRLLKAYVARERERGRLVYLTFE